METTKVAALKPHSELFRAENNQLIEVEWLIVNTKTWHADVLSEDASFRVRPLPRGLVLAIRAKA